MDHLKCIAGAPSVQMQDASIIRDIQLFDRFSVKLESYELHAKMCNQ